ncbi:MAG: hypothetical protein K6T16_00425 [Candidatus Pacearchaeota archaeon]|nr:hypothetical protein [Candidatus Pacearchaeota archaeon]
MKRNLMVLSCISLIFLLFVIPEIWAAAERHARVEVSLLNQDPYPAQQEDYVTIVFKVENVGGVEVKDVLLELLPQYPFSLDPGVSTVREIGTLSLVQYGEKAIFVKYKIRVDKEAIDGENEISVRYVYDTGGKWEKYTTKKFNVTIEDSRTDFDVAIQDYSAKTNSLSLAISNIGDKDAASVTVSLPEQNGFDLIGSDKNILGGIEANDYTIASFKIVPKQDGPVIVKIAYTDVRGIRREVEKAVIFKASGYNQQEIRQGKIDYRSLIYVAVGIIGIIVILIVLSLLRKRRKQKA